MSLSGLEKQLDPAQFYRINRKYAINIKAIKRIKANPKSKLYTEVYPPVSEKPIISQEMCRRLRTG